MWRTLTQVQRDWDRFAEADPLWAILTDPRMKNRKWDRETFFETGRQEIEGVMRYAESLPVKLGRRRALDFGCGAGRLTRALAFYFDEVYGVDISPAMIKVAREFNAQIGNCTFVRDSDPSLQVLEARDFDLIYSMITLQHIPPRYSRRYLGSMVRLLRPGGLLIFQLPSRRREVVAFRLLASLYNEIIRRWVLRAEPWMDMYGIRKEQVIRLIARSGGQVLDVEANDAAGKNWIGYRYAVVRLNPDGAEFTSPHRL